MGNPFLASNPVPQEPRPQEVDPDDTPHLKCRVCKVVIVRSVLGSNVWVHEDDAMILPAEVNLGITFSQYDHEAQPDYIEVIFRDTTI